MRRLINEGFSPKVSAKTWTCETTIALNLKHRQPTNRVLLLRLEDILFSPLTELKKITHFLKTEKGTSEAQLTGNSQLEKMSDGTCQRLLKNHLTKGSQLKGRYKRYLLGTYPKKTALIKFDCAPPPTSASVLLFKLGYESSIRTGEPATLHENEQFLSSPRASFINPLADYTKSPNKFSAQTQESSTHKLSALYFWQQTQQKTEPTLDQKSIAESYTLFPFIESNSPDFLPPENTPSANHTHRCFWQ